MDLTAVAPRGPRSAQIGFKDHHPRLRRQFKDPQRGPQTGIAATDDHHVGALVASQWLGRRGGSNVLQPKRPVRCKRDRRLPQTKCTHAWAPCASTMKLAYLAGSQSGIGRGLWGNPPRWVQVCAAAIDALCNASRAPRPPKWKPARKVAMKLSPAPHVSTTSTSVAGACTTFVPSSK